MAAIDGEEEAERDALLRCVRHLTVQ
jgi:hypothetical protein